MPPSLPSQPRTRDCGGDGPNEHPSQALLDLYTMRTEIAAQGQSIDGLSIALIGDLCLWPCCTFSVQTVVPVCRHSPAPHLPPELALPDDIIELLRAAGQEVHEFNDMAEGIWVLIFHDPHSENDFRHSRRRIVIAGCSG